MSGPHARDAPEVHAVLAVVGRQADPEEVHGIKSHMRHVARDERNMLVLDCMMDDITAHSVRRGARLVRHMRRDAARQGVKLRVYVAAAGTRQGRVLLHDGYQCDKHAFVDWMRDLVSHRPAARKSASPPVNDGSS